MIYGLFVLVCLTLYSKYKEVNSLEKKISELEDEIKKSKIETLDTKRRIIDYLMDNVTDKNYVGVDVEHYFHSWIDSLNEEGYNSHYAFFEFSKVIIYNNIKFSTFKDRILAAGVSEEEYEENLYKYYSIESGIYYFIELIKLASNNDFSTDIYDKNCLRTN